MNVLAAFLVFFVLAVALVVGYSARTTGKVAKKAEAQDARDPRVEALDYQVPDGQDPAVLISALQSEGYTADLEVRDAGRYLAIACPAGRERERARVRNVLAQNHMASIEGPSFSPGKIAFEDEKQ